jgi:predicted DNA-binding WGR domain protein
MPAKRATEGPLDLFADFDPMDIGKEQENAPMYNHFKQQEYGELERMLRKATIKLAYENPELREHLIPILKAAKRSIQFKDGDRLVVSPVPSGLVKSYPASKIKQKMTVTVLEDGASEGLDVYDVELDNGKEDSIYGFQIESKGKKAAMDNSKTAAGAPKYKDYVEKKRKKGEKPLKKDQWEARVLNKGKPKEDKGEGGEKIEKAEKPYKKNYPKAVAEVMDKHNMTDDDADAIKSFKESKPRKPKEKLTDSQLMQRFLSKAKPETKERMKGMSPADFMKILGAIMDDEGAEGGGKQAALRMAVIKLAKANPELRKHLVPILAADTFKCPECGTKVLKATGYCGKCKKKVEEKGAKKAQKKKSSSLKTAHLPLLYKSGLNASAVSEGNGAMLYFIDSEANHSKCYEMLIRPESNGSFTLMRRWGALTDSGETGRMDAKDQNFPTLGMAQAELTAIYKSKTRKGYIDAFGPAHKSPADGKKLKRGEYPVGLDRQVGFGWGTQSITKCVPALHELVEHLDAAIAEIQESGTSEHVKTDLEGAMATLSAVAKEDSTMASKVKGYLAKTIRRLSGTSRHLPDPEGNKLAKELKTIIGYVKKQTAYCG